MMIIFLALYLVLSIFGVKLYLKENEIAPYTSRDATESVKGIFIILVFFSHFNYYVALSGSLNSLYSYIINVFGQTMVTLFLFYSGYGVMESIKNKGEAYINTFPKKRILTTLINFDIAVLLFLVLALILGNEITPYQVIFSFIGWESLGNSNWYIFVILLLYLFTFISFKLFLKRSKFMAALCTLILTLIYVAVFMIFKIKVNCWFDTALCYPLGMFFSLYKEKFEGILLRKRIIYFLSLFISLFLFLFFMKFYTIPFSDIIRNLCFTLAVVILTARVSFKNKALIFCGRHLFEIYILQRLPMIIFAHLGLNRYPEIFFIICIISTLLLVFPFKFICGKISGAITRIERN